MKAKLSEIWEEVEKSLSENTISGRKMAIIEAHKVLQIVLDSKGYPGKNLEKKLFWAGYSLKDKEGLNEFLEKYHEVLNQFEYQLSDLEAEELVKKTKHVINEISAKKAFSAKDRIQVFFENYFSPSSILFWRNIAVILGFFAIVKILATTNLGKSILDFFVNLSNFIISWAFVAVVIGIIIVFLLASNYFKNKSKVKIKEEKDF